MFQEKRACNISEILSMLSYLKRRQLDVNMGNMLFKEEKNTEDNGIWSKGIIRSERDKGICKREKRKI